MLAYISYIILRNLTHKDKYGSNDILSLFSDVTYTLYLLIHVIKRHHNSQVI